MAYGLISLVASVILGVRYVASEDASGGSKFAVGSIVASGLLIWWLYPQWLLVGTILQVAVSIFVLIHFKVHAV